MNRRYFLKHSLAGSAMAAATPHLFLPRSLRAQTEQAAGRELAADVVIAGGGLGGCAAALAALRRGLRVVLTEETDWVGGQLTQQGAPPDEHRWIESSGCTRSYRRLREEIRDYYRRHYPLTDAARARPHLNPGDGSVSRLCIEPRAAVAVLESLFAGHLGSGKLTLLLEHRPLRADVDGDRVKSVTVRSLRSGNEIVLRAPFFVDATELGDLLALTGAEFVTGAESRKQTGERHAAEEAKPLNQQALTVCFAVDYLADEDHTIERPADYAFWRDFVPKLKPPWPGRLLDFTYTHPSTVQPRRLGFNPDGPVEQGLLNLWTYRRIARKENFEEGAYSSDITLVNWPQNDYFLGPLVGAAEPGKEIQRAKQLSLALLYWLQTEAPRPDGGTGFRGLRLRRDIMGTEDGLAKYPYVRESRRIRALFTVLEQHCGREQRAEITGKDRSEVAAEKYFDTVGVGSYHIDLHPSTGGDNYIDFASLPFQIPLGALLPQRMENLLPAAKNIGTTHVTNGCYRLHPVEWNIGEAAGALAEFCLRQRTRPHAVRADRGLLADFQRELRDDGVETDWPF